MAAARTPWAAFADVLRYPGASDPAPACLAALPEGPARDAFAPFAGRVAGLDRRAREELFLKTFELQAICQLELGYVLFGEDYKRGMLLAGLKDEHRRVGHDCGVELPDHLANVLELMELIDDPDLARDLGEQVLIPALRAMLGGFDDGRIRQRVELLKKQHEAVLQEELNYGNPYRHVLAALLLLAEAEYPGVPQRRAGRQTDNFIPIHDAAAEAVGAGA